MVQNYLRSLKCKVNHNHHSHPDEHKLFLVRNLFNIRDL